MSMNNPIADMLTRIRNASMASLPTIEVTSSKMKIEIAKILKSQGYIHTFIKEHRSGRDILHLDLKFDAKKQPAIRNIQVISKPGRRVYSGYTTLPSIRNNYGTLIVSTSSGVMTGKRARQKKIGGELICYVW